MPKMLAYPSYKPGMNILCDIRATPLPEVFNFKYVKNSHPSEMSHIEQQLGKCKIAVVVGNAKDFATIHQLSISTRLTPAKISKNRFVNYLKPRRRWEFRKTIKLNISNILTTLCNQFQLQLLNIQVACGSAKVTV